MHLQVDVHGCHGDWPTTKPWPCLCKIRDSRWIRTPGTMHPSGMKLRVDSLWNLLLATWFVDPCGFLYTNDHTPGDVNIIPQLTVNSKLPSYLNDKTIYCNLHTNSLKKALIKAEMLRQYCVPACNWTCLNTMLLNVYSALLDLLKKGLFLSLWYRDNIAQSQKQSSHYI